MICGERSCPVLALREGGVVSTANDTTQAVLDGMFPPQNTIRNGKRHPRGKLWIDVTDSTGPEDVDLDIDQAINDYLATRQ